jgi:hypothetical protein
MNGSAITIETRLARPEVQDACYAYDQGAYWLVEYHRNGTYHRQLLPVPPVGAICYASDDGFAHWRTFRVQPVPGVHSVTAALVLWILTAVFALPAAFLLLPGSVPVVQLTAGGAVAALATLAARLEYRSLRDPATVRRIAAASALYLAATHHRHAHHR